MSLDTNLKPENTFFFQAHISGHPLSQRRRKPKQPEQENPEKLQIFPLLPLAQLK